jgi:hypothetical protein
MKVLLSQACECGLEAQATVRVYGKRGATIKGYRTGSKQPSGVNDLLRPFEPIAF